CIQISSHLSHLFSFFFYTAPAPTEIYTLSLHDALPISDLDGQFHQRNRVQGLRLHRRRHLHPAHDGRSRCDGLQLDLGLVRDDLDRKSTRLNSSHVAISYAVFCLKKKNNKPKQSRRIPS